MHAERERQVVRRRTDSITYLFELGFPSIDVLIIDLSFDKQCKNWKKVRHAKRPMAVVSLITTSPYILEFARRNTSVMSNTWKDKEQLSFPRGCRVALGSSPCVSDLHGGWVEKLSPSVHQPTERSFGHVFASIDHDQTDNQPVGSTELLCWRAGPQPRGTRRRKGEHGALSRFVRRRFVLILSLRPQRADGRSQPDLRAKSGSLSWHF